MTREEAIEVYRGLINTKIKEAFEFFAPELRGGAFIAGAKWQKMQMMKEAEEGRVFMSFAPGHNQVVMADVDLPTNTKVKLIIIKED